MSRRARGAATRAIGTVVALAMVATSARFAAVLARGGGSAGQQSRDPSGHKAAYVKRELFIPMRDGVKLFTIVYAPRDASRKHPFLMTRTAYGIAPYGADDYRAVLGPSNEFAKEGYIFVYQDARGKFKSEGEFVHHVPYIRGSTQPN